MIERFVRKGFEWVGAGNKRLPIIPDENLIFNEQFTGPLDPNKWYVDNTTYGIGNIEWQWYDPANIEISDGTMKIWAKKETKTGTALQAPALSFASSDGTNRATPRTGLEAGSRPYTSGFIDTRNAANGGKYFPLFSRFELRARIPHGQGFLPAFWLRRNGGASWAEVDIMEYFFNYRPGESKTSLHFPNSLGNNVTQQRKHFEDPVRGTSGWHTWSISIQPSLTNPDPLKDPVLFIGELDGVRSMYFELTDEQAIRDLHMIDRTTGQPPPTGDTEVWDMAVNLAVGGRWAGAPDQQLGYLPTPDRCSRTQKLPPGGSTFCDLTDLFLPTFPALMEVDYVKVFDLGY